MPKYALLTATTRKQLSLIAALGLSSLLSIALVLGRMLYSDNILYAFLIWNLFLAWVPLVCALALWRLNDRPRRPVAVMAVLLGAWLLFFPNAPYIVTDLAHLGYRFRVPLWYDTMMVFSFAWNGIFLGLLSLWIVHRLVEGWFGRPAGWTLVAFTVVASGFGVYLGRFERWNSWDILTDPQRLALDVLDPLVNPLAHRGTVAVTLIFAAFLAVAYLMLTVLVNIGREEGALRTATASRRAVTPTAQSRSSHPVRTSPTR